MEAFFLDKASQSEDIALSHKGVFRKPGFHRLPRQWIRDIDTITYERQVLRAIFCRSKNPEIIRNDNDPVREKGSASFAAVQYPFGEEAPFRAVIVLPVVRVNDLRTGKPEKGNKQSRTDCMQMNDIRLQFPHFKKAKECMYKGLHRRNPRASHRNDPHTFVLVRCFPVHIGNAGENGDIHAFLRKARVYFFAMRFYSSLNIRESACADDSYLHPSESPFPTQTTSKPIFRRAAASRILRPSKTNAGLAIDLEIRFQSSAAKHFHS